MRPNWRRRVSHGAPAGRYFKPAGARRLGELERGLETRGLLRLHDHEGVSSWRPTNCHGREHEGCAASRALGSWELDDITQTSSRSHVPFLVGW